LLAEMNPVNQNRYQIQLNLVGGGLNHTCRSCLWAVNKSAS
jgi:hypothetical protein